MRPARILLSTLLLSLLLQPLVVEMPAQERSRPDTLLTVEKYLDYETVADPQISPDGSQIVFTRRFVNKLEDRWETALWIMASDGSKLRYLTKGGSPRWSPDGTRIAFVADGEPRGAQLFVRWMDAEGATSQIARLTESPSDLRWSPDGRSIGFSMFTPKPKTWTIDMPAAPKGANWTPAPKYVDALHYRADRRGFNQSGFVHLYVVPADGGTARQVTQGDWLVGTRFDGLQGGVGWSWMPDGRSIVVDGYKEANADLNYRNSNLYMVDVNTGATRRITTEDGLWTRPVVSPDGKWIAFAGHPATRASYRAEDLYLIRPDGSGMRKLSGSLDRDVTGMQWATNASGEATGIWFNADDRGTSNVYQVALSGGEPAKVTTGTHMLGVVSVAKSAIAAGVRSAFNEGADVVRVNLRKAGGEIAQLTKVNDDLLARVKLASLEEFDVPSTGGARVHGWIVKPPSFDRNKKYPLIMEIHGGPHGMYGVGFNFMYQNFAANDYVVLYTNPRGSTGYGSAFGNAIERAYPSVDYDDLMAAVDTVVGRGYVDTSRMYVGGCSGGGVLSSWVIGHTNRFAAAAVRCPVTNWLSMAGQTDVPLFTYNFFDKPFWEAPEKWLQQSPIMHVGKVQTPTLLMTGELDLRTPMPQSEEYYAALKMRGVPAALLRFEGEYHGTSSRPSNWMRTQLYMMSWYGKWPAKPMQAGQQVVP